MATRKAKAAQPARHTTKHEHTVLVLQGGGALGAYQAGAYEGLAEAGLAPDWVTGVSIGAINAALIAGNPPERRVERLRAFWDRVSSSVPLVLPPGLDPFRPALNRISAAGAMAFGINGFFRPRVPPAVLRRRRQPRRAELLRHRTAEAHAGRARRFRSHQRSLDATVGRRGQGADRRLRLFRQPASSHHGRPHTRQRRAAAGISAGDDRRRGILGRRHRLQFAALVRAGRFAAAQCADRPGRPLQRQRRAAA